MADAVATQYNDPNRASNRPTAKSSNKIVTPHPPQSVDRKSTKDALALADSTGGGGPKLGRSMGDGMLPDMVQMIDMIDKKFNLAKVTGAGAFCQTFKAVALDDAQLSCIKSVPKANFVSMKNDQYDAEIFKFAPKRNSVISMEARHPNVGTLIKAFQDETGLYLQMPECSGGDLFDKLAAGKLSGPVGQKFTAQIVSGLGYICGKSIAHRDIRPENYMLTNSTSNASVMLIDFALAKHCPDDTKMVTILGTSTYVAPEMLAGPYDKKVDVYSAGVVCFVCCTGRFPIAESDTAAQLAKVKAGEVDYGPIGDLMGQMPGLLKDMLTKDPFARPDAINLASREWLLQLGTSGGCCTVS